MILRLINSLTDAKDNAETTKYEVEEKQSRLEDIHSNLEDNLNNYLINDLGMNLTEDQQWAIGALEDLLGYSITTDLLLAKGE